MIDVNEFTVPDGLLHGESMLLGDPVPAIQLVRREDGATQLGLLTLLPAGSMIQICGHGFNERTTKVRVHDVYFFVYLQDLEIPLRRAATA